MDQPYIPLTVRVEWFPDGSIIPCMYWTPDESGFRVRHVNQCMPLAFLKERGEGLRFRVMAEALETSEVYESSEIYETPGVSEAPETPGVSEAPETPGVSEAPWMHFGNNHIRHETYLYFADDRFCGKNIIDERYDHASKEFIPVMVDIFPNGDYGLVCFWVSGERYNVEKTIAVEPRGSFHAGGVGTWHKVEARKVGDAGLRDDNVKRAAALYFEINKWFITRSKIP